MEDYIQSKIDNVAEQIKHEEYAIKYHGAGSGRLNLLYDTQRTLCSILHNYKLEQKSKETQ